MTSEKRRAAGIWWFHRIDLGGGEVTPGVNDPALLLEELTEIGLPEDMRGMRVLDIGCADGGLSFACERRGADVVSVDSSANHRVTFEYAARRLNSRCQYAAVNVYDLRARDYGMFDIVLALGLIYHLRHPLLALDMIHDVCQPRGDLFIETEIHASAENVIRVLEANELDNNRRNHVVPSVGGMKALLIKAGFRPAEDRVRKDMPTRWIFRAWKNADSRALVFRHIDGGASVQSWADNYDAE